MLPVAHSPTPSRVRIGRLLERGRKERAGGVRLVVRHEHVAALVVARETPIQLARGVELLLQPQGQSHQEELEAARRVGDVGLEDAVELEERLVVEGDQVELAGGDPAFLQAVVDGVLREVEVVLLAREALFLGGRDDAPVLDEAGGAVVVESGDSENVHLFRALPCSACRSRNTVRPAAPAPLVGTTARPPARKSLSSGLRSPPRAAPLHPGREEPSAARRAFSLAKSLQPPEEPSVARQGLSIAAPGFRARRRRPGE